jgi:hypothetical protein
MARVVIQAVVSLDGYIAYPDDTVGPLFDWYGNGGVTVHVNDKWRDGPRQRQVAVPRQPRLRGLRPALLGRH